MRQLLIIFFLVFWVCLLRAGPVLSAAVAGIVKPPSLDVVYVNANIGEAAGGHCAFRLGEVVYHYQFQDNGNFILVREPWNSFRLVYNELCNRSIFISTIFLTSEVFKKIRYHFNDILIEQQRKLQHFAESKSRLQVLERLVAGDNVLQIAGLGFFDRSHRNDPQAVSLRNYIDRVSVDNFRSRGIAQINCRMRQISATCSDDLHQFNIFLDQLVLKAVFQVLESSFSLAPDALVLPVAGEPRLSSAENKALRHYERQLLSSIVSLLNSSRPDRGQALLLQIARCLTVKKSLACGRMLTLDPFSDKVCLKAVDESEFLSSILQSVREESLRETVLQRNDFCSKTEFPEISYAFLEACRGRLSELDIVLIF